MGLKDLVGCTFLSIEDVEKLDLDFEGLEKVMESTTPLYSGITSKGTIKRLKKYISKQARKKDADLALINFQSDSHGILVSMGYSFSLYKYKN